MEGVVRFGTFAALAVTMGALSACGTPEYRAEKAACEAEWTRRIPPRIVEKVVTRTRLVPMGEELVCNRTAAGVQCVRKPVMVEEPYEAVEAIDINKPRRDAEIARCTAERCTRRYGDPACRVKG